MRSLCCILGLILSLFVISGGMAAETRNLGPDQAFQLVQQRKDLYLLDVRTPQEYLQARIAGARLIPIDQLARRIKEIPTNRTVLVYCAVGSRSAQVANYLARQGYQDVYNLSGGIYAWANRGLPILQGGP